MTEPGQVSVSAQSRYKRRANVGDLERVASAVLGGVMAFNGLARLGRRKPLRGMLLLALGGNFLHRATSGYCFLYDAMGVTDEDATFSSNPFSREIHVEHSTTIMKPAGELYGFWRDFSNLPRVMRYLQRVDVIDGTRSHWVAKGPADYPVEWDAEIVKDEPGEIIAWRSVSGSEVSNRGVVQFQQATAGRGTVISVDLVYKPPAGAVGAAVATLTGRSPAKEIREDLRHLKQVMETGETATTEGQPRGYCR